MLGNKRRPSNDTFESDDLTYQSSNKKCYGYVLIYLWKKILLIRMVICNYCYINKVHQVYFIDLLIFLTCWS